MKAGDRKEEEKEGGERGRWWRADEGVGYGRVMYMVE